MVLLLALNLKRVPTWDHNILDAFEDKDRQLAAIISWILFGSSGIYSSFSHLATLRNLNLADSLMLAGRDTNSFLATFRSSKFRKEQRWKSSSVKPQYTQYNFLKGE